MGVKSPDENTIVVQPHIEKEQTFPMQNLPIQCGLLNVRITENGAIEISGNFGASKTIIINDKTVEI